MTITRHAIGLSPFVDIPDFRVFATTPNSRVQRKDASMTTDTKHIARMALNVYGAARWADRSPDKAQARAELVVVFQQLCTDMGKVCTDDDRPLWGAATASADVLLCAAQAADHDRVDQMVNAGAIATLSAAVMFFGHVLGLRVADADDHARGAIEGLRSAAE